VLAVSILLIVTGAVLRFAVEASVPGVSLQKVGTILVRSLLPGFRAGG
jgi:hypothetical protein